MNISASYTAPRKPSKVCFLSAPGKRRNISAQATLTPDTPYLLDESTVLNICCNE
jgi:hypothetical protein